MNRKRIAIAGVALALVAAFITIVKHDTKPNDGYKVGYEKEAVDYQGQFASLVDPNIHYAVEIDEVDNGNGFERIMHLRPIGVESYVGTTGHDYNSDGSWDRIFYCGDHKLLSSHPSEGRGYGCNSVLRNKKGGWEFEACPADEGEIKPFSAAAIDFAVGELNTALVVVHTDSNVRERWHWKNEKEGCVKVYDAKSTST